MVLKAGRIAIMRALSSVSNTPQVGSRALNSANEARGASDWLRAVDQYSLYLQHHADDGPIWVQLGHALKELGRLEDAEDAYRTAAIIDPSDPDPLLHQAHLCLRVGKVNEATSAFERRQAIDYDEEVANILNHLPRFGPEVIGSIDGISGGVIHGWIKVVDSDSSLVVDLYADGRLIERSCLADIYREDLRNEGFDSVRHGFSLPIFAAELNAGEIEFSLHLEGSLHSVLSRTLRLGYEARIDEISENFLRGWAINPHNPGDIFDVNIIIDGHKLSSIKNIGIRSDLKDKGMSLGGGGLVSDLPLSWLESGEHIVSIQLPDDSILNEKFFLNKSMRDLANLSHTALQRSKVTVIVPVFNAADDLEVCVNRLIAHTPPDVQIIFIDDGSSDPRISDILDKVSQFDQVRVLRNAQNLGFTRTINRGFVEAGGDDVIILNSDARVTPRWVEGMAMAARSEPRIATVTAMSDRAGAFSAPCIGNDNPLPKALDENTYARAFRRQSLGLYPKVPTGNGFCMYISRSCLDEIGVLDADAFPRGYGEENDFCMRAVRAGWRNVIDDRTYVFHERSKSFGDAKTELMSAGRQTIDRRYPEYGKAIQVFSSGVKIQLARLRAKQALAVCPTLNLRVLFVVSTQTGGTPQTNRDLMEGLSDAIDGWILRCDSKKLELRQVVDGEPLVRRTHQLSEPVDPITHRSMEYEAVLSAWLLELDADIVHIRHLAWHSLMLPAIAKNLGCKVIFSFHDFYMVCPTVKLMDENSQFCGGVCTATEGKCRPELWPENSLPDLKEKWVYHWRAHIAAALKPCDGFVTTSPSAHRLIREALPSVPVDRFVVIPHGRDFSNFYRLRQTPVHGKPIRILVPGNIDIAKGRDVILGLLEQDRLGLLEFHVMGKFIFEGAPPAGIIDHGRYDRNDFAQLASTIGAHFGAIFSIWDETYCHTLTELWSIGMPAMVFDFPTVSDRVRESGAGWVLDHTDISALYDEILRIAFDSEEQRDKDISLGKWQAGDGARNTIRRMAADYLDLYKNVMRSADWPLGQAEGIRIGVVCPASADLRTANPSTYIRIWERTLNHPSRDVVYVRMTPQELFANLCDRTVDGAIIQRTAIPPTLVDSLLEAFNKTGIPYLFDIDDDLLNVPADKDPTGKYASYSTKLEGIVASARIVTVSTETLRTLLSPMNENAVVLPNRLSDRLWLESPAAAVSDGKIRALYMGTDSHLDDLRMVLPALDQVAGQDDRFELTLIGLRLPADDPIFLDRQRWLTQRPVPPGTSRYDFFARWLQSLAGQFDFGIAPLKNTPFNMCKSALKVLDYGALGLPSLVSDVEVYRPIANAAPSGVELVGNSEEQWVRALDNRLALAAGGRRQDSELRNWVVETQMLNGTLVDFDALVRSMIHDRPRPSAEADTAAFVISNGYM